MLIIIFCESSKEIYCGEYLNVLIKDITVVRDYAEYFDNSIYLWAIPWLFS